ncbi:MAG: hypothetical protein GY847_10360 [Proteobacteria bacterium]|nr:hypothetical protein [Pseudomonadota bacterium]
MSTWKYIAEISCVSQERATGDSKREFVLRATLSYLGLRRTTLIGYPEIIEKMTNS